MFAIKNLLRKKFRNIVALLVVSACISLVPAISGMTEGLKLGIRKVTGSYRGDIIVIEKTAADALLSRLNDEDLEAVRAIEGVAYAEPYIFTFFYSVRMQYLVVFGFKSDGKAIEKIRVVEGAPIKDPSSEVLLGLIAARQRGFKVGDPIEVGSRTYSVCGFYSTDGTLQDSHVAMDFDELRSLTGTETFVLILTYIDSGAAREVVKDRINSGIPRLAAYYSEDFLSHFEGIELMDLSAEAFGILGVFVGCLGVLSVMMMNVFERTREIGLLKAVGWSPYRIMGTFLVEALVFGLLGGVLGFFLGVLEAHFFSNLIQKNLLTLHFGSLLVAKTVVLSVFAGLLGGLVPAVWAARLDPVEALRYE